MFMILCVFGLLFLAESLPHLCETLRAFSTSVLGVFLLHLFTMFL